MYLNIPYNEKTYSEDIKVELNEETRSKGQKVLTIIYLIYLIQIYKNLEIDIPNHIGFETTHMGNYRKIVVDEVKCL